ncbi:uncharacterized protein LOC126899276 isoform X2 [Daktulosphaira vitifoliae]|uniref:uncharacterized protein LOC126899276 isoform X2 n=1 Tax=Daktulosphaira vitifoliae TaxID=58002 RepID=UPI0021AAA575|nr:uncharacterized protein LOC126899276 isoform X2 [Daktulosphaira vitifoliae]
MYYFTNNALTVEYKSTNIPVYFNPIDEDWKREKCSSLGFTYKKPITNQEFTPFMVPVERVYTTHFPIILSELICGDRKIRKQFARNIIENLVSNEDIKKLFQTKDMFEKYIAKTTILKAPNEPIDEEVVKSKWYTLEILAAAYYLKTCIYVYDYSFNVWILLRNSYTTFDSKNEKCIYLYLTKNRMGVVTNLTSP